jgi:hypothetical protein
VTALKLPCRFPPNTVASRPVWGYSKAMTETTASQIRTGHVIATPYGGRHRTLEVAYTVRERFTNPEGVTAEVVRFSGWELSCDGIRRGAWVEAGWGQRRDGRVYIVADNRRQPVTFGSLA